MKNKISIVSSIDGLELVEELKPRPAFEVMPEWYKKVPRLFEGQKSFMPGGPVKRCPSFKDWFNSGIVFPMWCDVQLANDGVNWEWLTSSDKFIWEIHDNKQFIDFLPNNVDGNVVYKAGNPWKIVTPKGWSVMQLPMFYHFNNDFEVLPGIIDTDVHHEVNPQVLLKGNKDIVYIKSGTPFFQLIPFKRESFVSEIINEINLPKKLAEKMKERNIRVHTSFTKAYKKNKKYGV